MVLKEGDLLNFRPKEFVIRMQDFKNNNSFPHQPHFMSIDFYNPKTSFQWDFQKDFSLKPRLSNFFYMKPLTLPSGEVLTMQHNTYEELFSSLVRLPVTDHDYGAFKITVKDANGNSSYFRGSISK